MEKICFNLAATRQLRLKYDMIKLLVKYSNTLHTNVSYFTSLFPAGEQRAQPDQPNTAWSALPPQNPGPKSHLSIGVLHRRPHQLHRRQKHELPAPKSEWPLATQMFTSQGQMRQNQTVKIYHWFPVRCTINSWIVPLAGQHPPSPPSFSAPPRTLNPTTALKF